MLWKQSNSIRISFFLPFFIFCFFILSFFIRLLSENKNQDSHFSGLVGKKAPVTDLPAIPNSGLPGFRMDSFLGKFVLVNIFSSWCVSCRDEHSLLMSIAQDKDFALLGINYKDDPEKASQFLKKFGNPYARVGMDIKGHAALEWGIYGIPETFIVSPEGTILFRHAGSLTQEVLDKNIYRLVRKNF